MADHTRYPTPVQKGEQGYPGAASDVQPLVVFSQMALRTIADRQATRRRESSGDFREDAIHFLFGEGPERLGAYVAGGSRGEGKRRCGRIVRRLKDHNSVIAAEGPVRLRHLDPKLLCSLLHP